MSPITIVGGEYRINNGPFTSAPGTVVNGDTVVVRVQSSPNFSTTNSATLTIGGASGRSSTFYVRTRDDSNVTAIIPQVALGSSHSYVLSSRGTVYAVGYNGNGQLGNGTTFSTPLLRPVAGLGRITAIAAGANHGLALKSDGTVAAWGYNAGGQLGSGVDTNSERYFVDVSNLTNIIAIAAGEYHSLALKQDGTVWAWGLNVDGQIGQGSTTTSRYLTPVQVKGIGGSGLLTGVTAIAAGNRHNLAVLVDGTVVTWGNNASGQLGTNSTAPSSSPVAVSGLTNIVAVAAGGAHSLALKNDATVVAWGDNAFGQLGVGDTTNRLTPTAVPGLTQVGRIAVGATHSIAVRVGGQLYTWGNNANRQLDYAESGQVSTPSANRTSPTLVVSVPNVFAIAAGGRHSAGLRTNGELYVWGDNFFGQVGNKSGNYSPHSGALNLLRGDAGIAAFAGNVVTSIGGSSSSGTSIVTIDGLATGYDFGNINTNPPTPPNIDGSFKNNDLTQVVSGVDVTVENSAGSAFNVQKLTCNTSLNANESCDFRVTFNPTTSGDYAGNLKIVADLPGSPELRNLFGKAIAPASPGLKVTGVSTKDDPYLVFATTPIGTPSDPTNIVIQNVGTATLSITSASITAGASDFSLPNPNACASVAPTATCNLPVVFNPSGPNARDGAVTLTTNAGSKTITLQGVAISSAVTLYPLSVTISGTGTGTVTTAPTGINCPGDCAESFTSGTMVTLTANPGMSTTFTGWSGACTGTGTCNLTMDAAKSVTATFTSTVTTYVVSGVASPMAGGTVSCTSPVNQGSTTTCTATPAMGYTLTNISGCSGTPGTTSPYTTGTITAACTVTATFAVLTVPNPPTIGTATAGNGQVTIAFTAPMNTGGSPITGYTATCGGQMASGANSPITVMGLPNGTPVSCTVVATNAIGSSSPSAASNSVTPTAPTIALLSVQSRKNHGSAGDQFLPIALNLPINGPITIEPRDARRGHTLIFDFATAIATAGTATVIDAAAQPIGQAYTTPSGNTVVVTLTNIPDNQRVTVQLAGINGFGTASVSLGFLVGDINGSQKVNGADFSAIKAKAAGMGTPVTAANYKLDLNQSGTIDNADLTMAKARAGWAVQ